MAVISTDAKRQYEVEGYTLARGLIAPSLLAPIREVLLGFAEDYQGFPPQNHFQILDPRKYRGKSGDPIPAGVQRPASHSPAFAAVADHPDLQAAMADLLGGPVRRHTDQALIKWGWLTEGQGGRSYYHQDSYYWRLAPRLGANAWIALDEVGAGAIALAIMPGTHRDWTLLEHEHYYDDPALCSYLEHKPFQRHRIPESQVDYSREVLVPMQPGDALFFTNFTWHRSEPNCSGRPLSAYAIAYRLADGGNAAGT